MKLCPTHTLPAVHVPYVMLSASLAPPGYAAAYTPYWVCPVVRCSWEEPA